MRLVRLMNLRHLRGQPVRTLLALVAVAAGVSMALGVAITYTSVDSSLAQLGRQLAGAAPLRVVGADLNGGIEASVLPRVTSTPGVAAAVPVVQTVAMAIGPRADEPVLTLGVECSDWPLLVGTPCPSAGAAPST